MFQRVEDLFCQSLRNTRHFCNFFDTCITKALQTSHIFQQHLATLWPDTFDGLKRAGAFHLRPLFTMPANRMIVRFIADMLDNVQCRRIRRQTKALTFRLKEQCFQTCFTIGPFCHPQQEWVLFVPGNVQFSKPPSINMTSGILLSSIALP